MNNSPKYHNSMISNNKNKVIDYIEKHKDEMDKNFVIMICQLLIKTNFDYVHLKLLLKGANFIVKDSGYFYKKWCKYSKHNKSIFKNSSSHKSCNKQVRIGKNKICNINGHINHSYDCLIGTICESHENNTNHKNCHTWFQFEKTRLHGSIINKLKHSFDYLHHVISRKNIGPFGKSHNTDKNPIVLKFKKELKK